MARAKAANSQPQSDADGLAQETKQPVIEYFGEGAEDVEFTIDPNATRIRVYNSGLILTDY